MRTDRGTSGARAWTSTTAQALPAADARGPVAFEQPRGMRRRQRILRASSSPRSTASCTRQTPAGMSRSSRACSCPVRPARSARATPRCSAAVAGEGLGRLVELWRRRLRAQPWRRLARLLPGQLGACLPGAAGPAARRGTGLPEPGRPRRALHVQHRRGPALRPRQDLPPAGLCRTGARATPAQTDRCSWYAAVLLRSRP